jgi:hypothetical protein
VFTLKSALIVLLVVVVIGGSIKLYTRRFLKGIDGVRGITKDSKNKSRNITL